MATPNKTEIKEIEDLEKQFNRKLTKTNRVLRQIILKKGKRKRVIKDSTVFHFEFPDRTVIEIDGKLLTGRPENRLKKRIRRLW